MSAPAIEIVHPAELAPADAATWSALQDATPAFGNPLLGPDFARAVGAVRKDARVAIWRDRDGSAVAFLAHHRRPQGFGRPIGAPFCDYHALVCGPKFGPEFGLEPNALISAAKLDAFRLSGLVDPFGLFDSIEVVSRQAYRIVLHDAQHGSPPSDAGLAYLDGLKAGSANRFKNFRRYSKRLEQAFGPVRLVAQDLDRGAFHRLLDWKRQQLARTGLHDFMSPPWISALMQRLFDAPGDRAGPQGAGFGGLMISLYAGDRHVAGHFGVRLGGWYHPWLGATAPNLEALGAGFVHQWKAVEAMGRLGLHTYDLGPGSDHWKRLFTSDVVAVKAGLITAQTPGGVLALAGDRIWTTPPLDRLGLAARVRNRLDQIATIETAWSGRARGVLAMAAAFERRAAFRRSDTVDPGLDAAAQSARSLERRTS